MINVRQRKWDKKKGFKGRWFTGAERALRPNLPKTKKRKKEGHIVAQSDHDVRTNRAIDRL